MMTTRSLKISMLVFALAAPATAAKAHHSFAMFDTAKELTISGTVKEWQFSAPHSWLQVMTTDASGKQVLWSFEGGGPSRGQLRRDSFKPGEKVAVKTHPMRDGRTAGSLGDVAYGDGRQLVMNGP